MLEYIHARRPPCTHWQPLGQRQHQLHMSSPCSSTPLVHSPSRTPCHARREATTGPGSTAPRAQPLPLAPSLCALRCFLEAPTKHPAGPLLSDLRHRVHQPHTSHPRSRHTQKLQAPKPILPAALAYVQQDQSTNDGAVSCQRSAERGLQTAPLPVNHFSCWL